MNNNHGRRRTRRVRQQRKQQKTQIGRILLTVGLMALIAVVSIGGTIAWLTDDTEVITNTFTPSDINISIEETDAVNGEKSFPMVPGAKISKDPKVTVAANSENLWLFVEIQESQLNNEDTKVELDKYLTYSVENGWTLLEPETYDAEANYYVYYRQVSKNTEEQEFGILVNNEVQVKDSVTKTMMEAIMGDNASKQPTLSFKAYAIQSDNLAFEEGVDTEAEKAAAAWALAKPATTTP